MGLNITTLKPEALGPVANTNTKPLIYGLFQKGRVLAQDAGDFLEAARPAADDDELLITCRAWVHVEVGGHTSAQ